MLLARYEEGILRITSIKSIPGMVLVQRTADQVSAISVAGGVSHREVGMDSKPLSVRWIPEDCTEVKAKSKLRQGEHRTPPKGKPRSQKEYAGPHYDFPVDTESHVRAALAYFSKHKWKDNSEKRGAARKIMAAAKRHGVHVSKDDDVARAARS